MSSVPVPNSIENALTQAVRTRGGEGRGLSWRDGEFAVTFELLPARASRGRALDDILVFAREAARSGVIGALSITDNAGGHPALAPKALGQEILALGVEPIIHFSCKDKNRNTVESELFELDRAGLHNILVLTGDYPRYGLHGDAKPVFDLDSVQVLGMVSDMNRGFVLDPRAPGGGVQLPPMRFHAGCVVSPFKRLEAELLPQYLKLRKKIASGARFVISQMGFDVRKYDELRRFMDLEDPGVPLLGTVFIPTLNLARILQRGGVPGCVLPARLLAAMEQEAGAPDGGLAARIERGARMVAILRGLGFNGVHLSGPGLKYAHVERVLERANAVGPAWTEHVREFLFPEEWEFWYFREDPETGLNSGEVTPRPRVSLAISDAMTLKLGRFVHRVAFEPELAFHPHLERLAGRIEGSALQMPFTAFEYWVKYLMYGCQHCGDCTLDHLGFLCPQWQCAKYLLNGPCGGSRNGWCEVWPGRRRCLYVKVYERLSSIGEVESLAGEVLPPRNWALYRTASWLNFFLRRDHHRPVKKAIDNPDRSVNS